jgi:hypothetical protein
MATALRLRDKSAFGKQQQINAACFDAYLYLCGE